MRGRVGAQEELALAADNSLQKSGAVLGGLLIRQSWLPPPVSDLIAMTDHLKSLIAGYTYLGDGLAVAELEWHKLAVDT